MSSAPLWLGPGCIGENLGHALAPYGGQSLGGLVPADGLPRSTHGVRALAAQTRRQARTLCSARLQYSSEWAWVVQELTHFRQFVTG